MNSPDFMKEAYNNILRTDNVVQKFHKLIHYNLFLLRYITALTYASLISSNTKNTTTERLIVDTFQRPTEGQWFTLLENISKKKNHDLSFIDNLLKELITNDSSKLFNSAYSFCIDNTFYKEDNITIYNFFKKIISMKNRVISHGLITEEKAKFICEALIPIMEDVYDRFNKIFAIEVINVYEDYNLNLTISPCNNKTDRFNEYESISDSGIYCYVNNKFITLFPFLTCKDGEIFFYDNFDVKSNRINYHNNLRSIYIKTSCESMYELFNIDRNSLLSNPLKVLVRISQNGICHNLPSKDFDNFIGRKNELLKLDNMVTHERHFITALDGIGGVGKSAIALEYCTSLLTGAKDKNNYFEYIIWVSAKTTIFENGSIRQIKQSFQHFEQLLDAILDVMSFSEYKDVLIDAKKAIIYELLATAKTLIVLDNLETISSGNISDIWTFINDIPVPSKVLLTSREYHQNVPQTLRIENLSREDSMEFLIQSCEQIKLNYNDVSDISESIIDISSGIPIAIKSIIGQISLGKSYRSICKSIEKNTDNLAEFCFKEQLSLLTQNHMKILLLISFSIENLDLDSITYMMDDLDEYEVLRLIDKLNSLSIIKIEIIDDKHTYSMLPLIKTYVLISTSDDHLKNSIKLKLTDYYSLKDVEPYHLYPLEQRVLNKTDIIPRKLIDKAMIHAEAEQLEEADIIFRKVLEDFENDSYVWFMYSEYLSKYQNKFDDAVSSLKKANTISENYYYLKKIGDLQIKLKNYDAAIKYYQTAQSTAEDTRNMEEMHYCIGTAMYAKVRKIRQQLKSIRSSALTNERSILYGSIIENFEKYLEVQPKIYDGKKIKVFRILSEAYFGIRNYEKASYYIENAIDLSDLDDTHIQYKKYIQQQMQLCNCVVRT